jgi:hypothetical protein
MPMSSEPVPVLGHFPTSLGVSEPIAAYRHEHARRMRLFVIYWIGELADYPTIPEDQAVILCNYMATGQVQRPLRPNEEALLAEGVRDVIVARESRYRMAEWTADYQAGHAGEAVQS